MKKSFYLTFGIGIALLAIIGFLLYQFSVITISIVGGFLLYLLIDQMMEVLERNHVTGAFAYFCIFLFFAIVILAIVTFVALPLVDQVQSFAGQLPQFLNGIHEHIAGLQEHFPFVTQIYDSFKEKGLAAATDFVSHVGAIVTSIVTMFLMSIILVASRGTLRQSMVEKIPNDYFEVSVSIAHRIVSHIKQYVAAKAVETVIMTILYFIGFWAIGLPAPMLFAIIGGILNLIPYIGVIFTAIPVGIAALISGSYTLLGLSLLVLLVARAIDDFVLQTFLIGHFVDVHPFLVVLITVIGGELMGVIGLVIAIPFYVISRIVVIGLYDYLRTVQRHEMYLHEEEGHNKHHAAE